VELLKMKQESQEIVKTVGDAVSVFTVVGTLVNMLPSIAALITIVWTSIRIYETDTVKDIISRWKQHRLMALVANDPKAAKRLGIPAKVGKEFMKADKGRKFKGKSK